MTPHEYRALIRWERGGAPFTDRRYSRAHSWTFDGGIEVVASSSPLSVPLPFSRADAVDPEEAYVAALSSCHMLFFLSLAAQAGLVVEAYEDEAVGVMTRSPSGQFWLSRVVLRPKVTTSGQLAPRPSDIAALHHRAHRECYIANSVRTEVIIEPVDA